MKKTFIPLLLLSFLLIPLRSSYGQEVLSHYDFEEWTDANNPVDWSALLTLNIPVFGIEIPLNLTFGERTTDCYSGQYALKLNPFHFPGMLSIPAFTIPGIAQIGSTEPVTIDLELLNGIIEGNLDFSNLDSLMGKLEGMQGLISKGVPISGNPEEVGVAIKFLPADSTVDTMSVIVATTKWNDILNTKEIVGTGFYFAAEPIEEYTKIAIPISNELESTSPDTIMIIFVVGGLNANEDSELYVDELYVMSHESAIREAELNYVLYPNPTSGQIYIRPDDVFTRYTAHLFDLSGKKILQMIDLTGETAIDLSSYSSGTYLLELRQGSKKITHKVVIE